MINYSPIYKLNNSINGNNIYIKRDDLIPFSFGGNKVRKASKFFQEIIQGDYNHVITYGSSSSNHCRIIANMAKKNGIRCTIISLEGDEETFNSYMVKSFGAEVVYSKLNKVSTTIDLTIENSIKKGYKTYFIPGGGHGYLGTKAYFEAYQEIKTYEQQNNVNFEYIFFASGTGGTQAGIVCGSLLAKDKMNVIGISIGRKKVKGLPVIRESVKEFLSHSNQEINERDLDSIILIDDYLCGGYGKYNDSITQTVSKVLNDEGIPLDRTYTGKAFWGMTEYIQSNSIKGKNILFIHTGGTPLFFSDSI